MKDLKVIHIIYFVFWIQIFFLVASFYNVIDSLLITWLPTIILSSIFFICIFAVFVIYKYIKKGRGKWFNSNNGAD